MLLPLRIIEVQRLGALASSITFSAISTKIPAGSRHLVALANAHIGAAGAFDALQLRFNGDAGANYNRQRMDGTGAVGAAARQTNGTEIDVLAVPGNGTNASAFGGGIIAIPHAFNSSNQKVLASLGGANEATVKALIGRWANLAAVDAITLLPASDQFAVGSIFALAVVDERYLIEEVNLTIDGVVNFANIPAGSDDLALVGYARSSNASLVDDYNHEINGDAVDGNYPRTFLNGSGAVIAHGSSVVRAITNMVADTAGANIFSPIIMNHYQHGRNQNDPHFMAVSGNHLSGATSSAVVTSARRNNIDPITSIGLSARVGTNFKAGSLFSLYHVPNRARLFDRRVLDTDNPEINFNGIPLVFDTDVPIGLQLYNYARSTFGAASVDLNRFQFNGDFVTTNYEVQTLNGALGATAAAQLAVFDLGHVATAAQAANIFGGGAIICLGHAETDRHKDRLAMTGNAQDRVSIGSGRWSNVAPVDDIRLEPLTGPNYLSQSVEELELIVDPTVDTLHLTFAPSLISQTFNVNYPGTWKTFPRIIVVGPLNNFRIDNLTTGEHIELTFNIPSGRTVTIDLRSGRKTVVDDLGTNLIGTVTADSQLGTFHIAAAPEAPLGVNQFQITGVDAEEGVSRVTLEWLNRYYGI